VTSRKDRYKRGAETYREQLLAAGLASADEIKAEWPGSEKNPRRDLDAWISCYAVLRGLCRVRETRDQERDHRSAKRQATIEAAMEERPETVECSIGPLTVYQKSKVALEEIQCLNLWLGRWIDEFHEIGLRAARSDVETLNRLLREQSFLQRCIVWIATTEGPGLPYPEQATFAEPPTELAELSPLDFFLISHAFQRVNVLPFSVLESHQSNTARPSWNVFWANMEEVTGVPAARLMRDRGLPSVVVAASERVRAYEEAQKRAEANRKRA
jgi:hypothetical protein